MNNPDKDRLNELILANPELINTNLPEPVPSPDDIKKQVLNNTPVRYANRANIAILALQALGTKTSEEGHMEADDILCSLLVDLGFKNVVDEYDKVGKWYA